MKFLSTVLAVVLCAASALCQTDGPAQLPQVTLNTSVAATPSNNTPKVVPATASLQIALSTAVIGDKYLVDPTLVYTGALKLPSLTCDGSSWVTVMSSGTIPAEGSPVVQGSQMPKIVFGKSQFMSGGNCFRFIGFEITRTPGIGVMYQLISLYGVHHFILDRSWLHGTPTDETQRGILLSSANHIGVVDSAITDFHCLSVSGSCSDSQTIAGGINDVGPIGDFVILRNSLSSSGENILFGGGADTQTPCDITISGNFIYKPDSWNPGDPTYTPVIGSDGLPHPHLAKNLLELKNACRVLISNNTMRGSWGGFSQLGFAILVTPKNQSNTCPVCQDHDITIRNNVIEHTGVALQIGFGQSDALGWPAGAYNYSFHDNQFTDLQYPTCFSCGHFLVQISSGSVPATTTAPVLVMHDFWLVKNSFLLNKWHAPNPTDGAGHGFLMLTAPLASSSAQMYNMHVDSNVAYAGNYPVYSTGGGAGNCVNQYLTNYALLFASCWVNSSVSNNVIINDAGVLTPWPASNIVTPSGANINNLPLSW